MGGIPVTAAYRLHRTAALRASQARKPPRSAHVTTVRVAAVVMAEALRLAEGDPRRLRIIDASTVLVSNPRKEQS
jgi:hypothetical protein